MVDAPVIPRMRDALAERFAPVLAEVEAQLGRAVSEAEFSFALQELAARDEPLAVEFAEALRNALLRATLAGRKSVA